MGLKLTNNATSTLSASIDTAITTIAVQSGHADRFPVLDVGDWCPITVVDGSGNMEIMKATARTGNALTVVRAQEGTTAKAFDAGMRVDVRLTSAAFATKLEATSAAFALKLDPANILAASAVTTPADGDAFGLIDVATGLLRKMSFGALKTALANAFASIFQPHRIGQVIELSGPNLPAKCIWPVGQNISRTTYAAYFAEVGTIYGAGDGSTTFGVPDYRGRVRAGKDDMGGSSANRLTAQTGGLNGDVLGAAGGAETVALSVGEMPTHAHSGTTSTDGLHAHGYTGSTGDVTRPSGTGQNVPTPTQSLSTVSAGLHNHTFTTSSQGSGAAHNNVQPTIVTNVCIYVGV